MLKEVTKINPDNVNALDLVTDDLSGVFKSLVKSSPEHKQMIDVVKEALPEIHRSTSLFYKTQSQFMDNMLTVSHPTPLRNVRQILAEMNKTRDAIKEAHFKILKKEVEIKIKKKQISEVIKSDPLTAELYEIEAAELYSQIDSTKGYISGAIRKLANYTEQYKAIIAKYNLQSFDEVDFEKEEEKYHIMKAFEQGTNAARARESALIDEGNLIYFTQIGINPSVAQEYVKTYIGMERSLLREKKEPTHQMFLNFLEEMANRFAGCSGALAEKKGMKGTMTELAALTNQSKDS